MIYKNLFSVAILHNYFSDNTNYIPEIDQYIGLVPDQETQALIKQYRLKLYTRPGRLILSTPERTTAQTFLPSSSITFRFFLEIRNPVFYYFTDLQALSGFTFPRFYTSGSNTTLTSGAYQYKISDVFEIPQERNAQTSFFLRHTPLNTSFEVQGLSPAPTLAYDAALKKVSFDTTPGTYQDAQPFELIYEVSPRWSSSTLGIVEIGVDGSNITYDRSYTFSFGRKSQNWSYYVIAPDTVTAANLAITNGVSDPAWNFANTVETTSGDVFQRLKNTFPAAKIFNITSVNPLPYQKQAKTGLKLQQSGETIINNLPNPAPENEGVGILNIYS
ncbi:hypothetical protein BKI52_09955 [marine bacterium AO1-C]|nr:hypothetical protein BKI52_09955 [marine bacterium AO1-C]